MIHLQLGVTDISRVRFAFSPVWETVTSLRTLTAAPSTGVHGWWLRTVRTRVGACDMRLLTTLVRPQGYIPDFLHPVPPGRTLSFEAGLAALAATDLELVSSELAHLAQHRLAQQGPGMQGRAEFLGELAGRPEEALRRIVAELGGYWKIALAPYWPRIHALLQADLEFRLDQIATGGAAQLLRGLHPSITFDGDTLHVVKYYEGQADLGRRGLLLIPCAFAWPDVLVRTADPQPALTYAPRGLGRLWEIPRACEGAPLAAVIGQTRTSLLAHLDLPMTTKQLAGQLGISAPSVNAHLQALRAAGIVSARRDGRSVLYARTAVAEQLLTAHPGEQS
jgi:DNA-binding transcriptional ArsR family regulator